MKSMTFLAGVATGMLAHHYLNRRAFAGTSRRTTPAAHAGGLRPAVATGSEPDWPTHAPPRNDDELRERICAQLARTIAGADAIQVEVVDGCVTLRGQVQARDAVLLMAEVENMSGVRSVRNEADIQGSPGDVAPAMTRDAPAVRAGERASSHMS